MNRALKILAVFFLGMLLGFIVSLAFTILIREPNIAAPFRDAKMKWPFDSEYCGRFRFVDSLANGIYCISYQGELLGEAN